MEWIVIGLLAAGVSFLSLISNTLVDIKAVQEGANEVLGDIKLEVENINQKMESLMP